MYASKTVCMTLSRCILISAPRIRHQEKELRAHGLSERRSQETSWEFGSETGEKELYTECQQQAVLWTPGARCCLGPLGDSIELPLQRGPTLGAGPLWCLSMPYLIWIS